MPRLPVVSPPPPAPHVQAALKQPSPRPLSALAQPKQVAAGRPPAPHVQAALARCSGSPPPEGAPVQAKADPRAGQLRAIPQPWRDPVGVGRNRTIQRMESKEEDLGRYPKRQRAASVDFLGYARVGAWVVAWITAKTENCVVVRNDLDRLADHIVSQRSEGTYQGTNVVAVGMTGTPRYVVAMNDFTPGEVVAALGPEGGQWLRETAGGDAVHAEMRIVQGGQSKTVHIGISKPCCPPCARALQILGKTFGGCHGEYFDKWAFPPFLADNPANLEKFLGPKAWKVYSTWSPKDKEDFIRYLSGHMRTLSNP